MKIFKHLRKEWFRYGFETLAVIVGILVAFALDNWNEERKLHLQEQSLLHDLIDNLESDYAHFESAITYQTDYISRIAHLIEHLEANKPYEDSLKYDFMMTSWFEEFSITSTAYETIKAIGIEKVTSNELKKAVAYYYDVSCANYRMIINNVNSSNAFGMQNFYLENFREDMNGGTVPSNYSALLASTYYINYLYYRIGWKKDYISFLKSLMKDTRNLLEIIDIELEKFN